MKKEKTQSIKEKRSVTDFEHRMTVTLEPKHDINYAMTHSRDQIKKARKRAIFWAIFFFVLGAIALFKGASMEGSMADIYLVAGILMIVYQLFNLFYHFVMFPVALKRSVSKELKKDPSLLSPMEYAFEPDKIVCFLDGKHRNSVLMEDILGVEDLEDTLIIQIKGGKRMIFPQNTLEQADPVIQKQIKSLQK